MSGSSRGYLDNQIRRCNRNLLITIIGVGLLWCAAIWWLESNVVYAIMLSVLGVALCFLWYSIVFARRRDYGIHPMIKRLNRFGDSTVAVNSINNSGQGRRWGKFNLLSDWFAIPSFLDCKFLYKKELVWAYEKGTTTTTHYRLNFIIPLGSSTSTSRSVVMHFRCVQKKADGSVVAKPKVYEVKDIVDPQSFLLEIHATAPQARIGYK